MKNTRTILVADVDEESERTLANFLTREGYGVETARNGTEVIQKVQNIAIDVLVMDVELGGMKGYEIAPILKKMDPELPIIMLSSDGSLELAKKVRETEIFFYAMKPLDLEEINLAVWDAFKRIGKAKRGMKDDG